MEMLFLSAAILGGTLMIGQFLLSLVGFGHEGLDHDLGSDGGGDLAGHDFASHDYAGHDTFTSSAGGHLSDSHDGHSPGHAGAAHGGTAHSQAHSQAHSKHDSTTLFRVLTFRTVVAALVFFGLAGLAAESAELASPRPLMLALASGAAAMYSVFYLMQSLGRLRADGTERIGAAVGREALVYLSIPAARAGAGKIHLTMQNRTLEYQATTAGAALPTGTRVIVVEVVGPSAVEVVAAETASATDSQPTRAHV